MSTKENNNNNFSEEEGNSKRTEYEIKKAKEHTENNEENDDQSEYSNDNEGSENSENNMEKSNFNNNIITNENHNENNNNNNYITNGKYTEEQIRSFNDAEHIVEAIRKARSADTNTTSEKKFCCPVEKCDKVYCSSASLENHIRSFHQNKYFECPHKSEGCTFISGWPSSMKSHIDTIHLGVRFRCPYTNCNYEATSEASLQIHVDSIHKKFRHACEYEGCKKSFSTKHQLREHVRVVHEKTTILKCDVCGQIFNSRTPYRRHVKGYSLKGITYPPQCIGRTLDGNNLTPEEIEKKKKELLEKKKTQKLENQQRKHIKKEEPTFNSFSGSTITNRSGNIINSVNSSASQYTQAVEGSSIASNTTLSHLNYNNTTNTKSNSSINNVLNNGFQSINGNGAQLYSSNTSSRSTSVISAKQNREIDNEISGADYTSERYLNDQEINDTSEKNDATRFDKDKFSTINVSINSSQDTKAPISTNMLNSAGKSIFSKISNETNSKQSLQPFEQNIFATKSYGLQNTSPFITQNSQFGVNSQIMLTQSGSGIHSQSGANIALYNRVSTPISILEDQFQSLGKRSQTSNMINSKLNYTQSQPKSQSQSQLLTRLNQNDDMDISDLNNISQDQTSVNSIGNFSINNLTGSMNNSLKLTEYGKMSGSQKSSGFAALGSQNDDSEVYISMNNSGQNFCTNQQLQSYKGVDIQNNFSSVSSLSASGSTGIMNRAICASTSKYINITGASNSPLVCTSYTPFISSSNNENRSVSTIFSNAKQFNSNCTTPLSISLGLNNIKQNSNLVLGTKDYLNGNTEESVQINRHHGEKVDNVAKSIKEQEEITIVDQIKNTPNINNNASISQRSSPYTRGPGGSKAILPLVTVPQIQSTDLQSSGRLSTNLNNHKQINSTNLINVKNIPVTATTDSNRASTTLVNQNHNNNITSYKIDAVDGNSSTSTSNNCSVDTSVIVTNTCSVTTNLGSTDNSTNGSIIKNDNNPNERCSSINTKTIIAKDKEHLQSSLPNSQTDMINKLSIPQRSTGQTIISQQNSVLSYKKSNPIALLGIKGEKVLDSGTSSQKVLTFGVSQNSNEVSIRSTSQYNGVSIDLNHFGSSSPHNLGVPVVGSIGVNSSAFSKYNINVSSNSQATLNSGKCGQLISTPFSTYNQQRLSQSEGYSQMDGGFSEKLNSIHQMNSLAVSTTVLVGANNINTNLSKSNRVTDNDRLSVILDSSQTNPATNNNIRNNTNSVTISEAFNINIRSTANRSIPLDYNGNIFDNIIHSGRSSVAGMQMYQSATPLQNLTKDVNANLDLNDLR